MFSGVFKIYYFPQGSKSSLLTFVLASLTHALYCFFEIKRTKRMQEADAGLSAFQLKKQNEFQKRPEQALVRFLTFCLNTNHAAVGVTVHVNWELVLRL